MTASKAKITKVKEEITRWVCMGIGLENTHCKIKGLW